MSNAPGTTLATQETGAELVRQQPTALEMIQSAINNGALDKPNGIEVIERLGKLQREMVQYEDMVAFNEAMHRCQQKMKRINTDMQSDKGRYASYAQVDRSIRPIYTAERMSLSFSDGESPFPDKLRLVCHVSRGGYTRLYMKDMPVDTKGAKGNDVMTRTHAQGSADSYAKRYLVKDIFNLAVGEDDDDGNGGMQVPEGQVAEWKTFMRECKNFDELKKQFAVAFKGAKAAGDANAKREITELYETLKKEMQA